jgi:hypothetical protein
VCPRDGRVGAAYVDAVDDPYAGLATHMLSYTWGYEVCTVYTAWRTTLHRPTSSKRVCHLCSTLRHTHTGAHDRGVARGLLR